MSIKVGKIEYPEVVGVVHAFRGLVDAVPDDFTYAINKFGRKKHETFKEYVQRWIIDGKPSKDEIVTIAGYMASYAQTKRVAFVQAAILLYVLAAFKSAPSDDKFDRTVGADEIQKIAVEKQVVAPVLKVTSGLQDMMGRAKVELKDLSGEYSQGSGEGEAMRDEVCDQWIFTEGMECAKEPHQVVDWDLDMIGLFVFLNASWIITHNARVLARDAIAAAFIRYVCVHQGLVNPDWDPNKYHVRYNNAKRFTDEYIETQLKTVVPGDLINSFFEGSELKTLMAESADRIACVAYVFRIRGHHYSEGYGAIYDRMWRSISRVSGAAQNLIPHDILATFATHAVFPIVLDQFWDLHRKAGDINGSLIKRFDSAAAGTASIVVCQQGIRDLLLIAPGIHRQLNDALVYLDTLSARIAENRWNGSVNARYYGAERIQIDERRLAAAAATVVAALKGLAPDAPLLRSAALLRIAGGAPLTGAILARTIAAIANDPAMARGLVVAPLSSKENG